MCCRLGCARCRTARYRRREIKLANRLVVECGYLFVTHGFGEAHHFLTGALEHLVHGYAGPGHLAQQHSCEQAIGIRVGRRQVIERRLSRARGEQDHLPRCRSRRCEAAGAADAAGANFRKRVVAAGIDDGNRKPHFLLSEVIEHALQHHGVVLDLFFVVCRDVGR